MRTVAQEAIQAELDRRWAEACARVTPEALSSGKHGERHMVQLAILRCRAQNMILMGSRRCGKSEVCCALLLTTSILTADVSSLYLALTKDAAEPIWRKWKKLLKKFHIPHNSSDADQYTEFPNGSRVLFTGTDDLRRVTHLLGDQLAGGIAIIDESQDDPGIMEKTVEDVLGPMLDETTVEKPIPGRLVLSGTVPDVPAGYFWRTWENNYDDTNDRERTADEKRQKMEMSDDENPSDLWAAFTWSRYENPFQVDNEKRERQYCAKYRLKPDDPRVLRRFRGKRIFEREATAYRFDPRAHTYRPMELEQVDIGPFHCRFASLPAGCDRFIVGIDQAQRRDRFTFVGWTWNHLLRNRLWQFFEAGTDPGGDPQESEWLAICATLRTRYPDGSMEFIRDAGGSSAPVNDQLAFSHGITIASAIKTPGSLKAGVQRLSDLMAVGVAKIIEGSQLADDMTTAKWSLKAREAGRWELDKSARSPDYCDAARYPLDLPSYTMIGGMKPPAPRLTEQEWLAAEQKKTLDGLLRGKGPRPPTIPNWAKLWVPPPK
jgi:hypothetical protein